MGACACVLTPMLHCARAVHCGVPAVHRSGVTDVIFPMGNKREYEDVPDDLKQGMTPHFVDSFEQVFELAFPGLESLGGSSASNSQPSTPTAAGPPGDATAAAAAAAGKSWPSWV